MRLRCIPCLPFFLCAEVLPELDSSVMLSAASVDSWLDSLAALELSSAFEDSSAALELSSGLDDSSSLELSSLASAFGNADSIAPLISAGVYPACQREVLSSISEILGLHRFFNNESRLCIASLSKTDIFAPLLYNDSLLGS